MIEEKNVQIDNGRNDIAQLNEKLKRRPNAQPFGTGAKTMTGLPASVLKEKTSGNTLKFKSKAPLGGNSAASKLKSVGGQNEEDSSSTHHSSQMSSAPASSHK